MVPLLASNGIIQGPGGASAFVDAQGNLQLAYAAYWLGETRSPHPRRLHIIQLAVNPDGTLTSQATSGLPPAPVRRWGRATGPSPAGTSWGSPTSR
jgi:hypothetical protein